MLWFRFFDFLQLFLRGLTVNPPPPSLPTLSIRSFYVFLNKYPLMILPLDLLAVFSSVFCHPSTSLCLYTYTTERIEIIPHIQSAWPMVWGKHVKAGSNQCPPMIFHLGLSLQKIAPPLPSTNSVVDPRGLKGDSKTGTVMLQLCISLAGADGVKEAGRSGSWCGKN